MQFVFNAVQSNENPRNALRPPRVAAAFWAWAALDVTRGHAAVFGALVAIAARCQVTSCCHLLFVALRANESPSVRLGARCVRLHPSEWQDRAPSSEGRTTEPDANPHP